MQPYNWNQFTRRVTIKAPAQVIYDAWANSEGIESWFLRKAAFTSPSNILRESTDPIQEGDHYEWLWFGYDDTVAETNEIMKANGRDFLQFGFSGGCIVSVYIKSEQGENICELVQQMTPPDEKEKQFFYIECGRGWTFYLANLKSVLEGGLDLRNRNVEIQDVINA
jgi:uncharacterized protein YndB with AHSA1/START domain